MVKCLVTDDFENISKELDCIPNEVIFRLFLGGVEENDGKPQWRYEVSWPRLEPRSFRIEIQSVTATADFSSA